MPHRSSGTLILLLALVASPWLYAQKIDDVKPLDPGLTLAHNIYKPGGGWNIEFIDTSNVLSEERSIDTPSPVYSGVKSVQLGLRSKIFNFQTIQFNRLTKDVTIEESRMLVLRVLALKKNGHVFAYEFTGKVENLVNGEWQPCLCGGGAMQVYDPDGKGKFSHLILYSSGAPYLPEWVRGGAQSQSKSAGWRVAQVP